MSHDATVLRYGIATRSTEFAAARELRTAVYRTRLGVDPDTWQDDDQRDHAGHVFLVWDGTRLIGTGRAVPVNTRRSELARLGRLPLWAERSPWLCEIGRVAALDGDGQLARSALAAFCGLAWGAHWLLAHTVLRRFIGYCRRPLLPLYRTLGATVLQPPFQIANRPGTDFFMVVGDLGRVAAAATEQGIELAAVR